MIRFTIPTWLLLAIPVVGQDVAFAARDLAGVPTTSRANIRYLTLAALPVKDRPEAVRILSGHVNGLSRESEIIPLTVIPGTALIRVNLEDFAWTTEVWEQLAEADPYFHVKVQDVDAKPILWPGGVWPDDGKFYKKGEFTYKPRQTTFAPWVIDTPNAKAELDYLVAQTHSQAPIVRGDWFLFQTAAQTDRKPGYYDFLGIKDRKDLEKLVGFNAKVVADAKRKELLEAVAESRVAQQPRRIGAFNTVGGMKYWRTFDSKLSVDKKNPLRVLDNTYEHDAEEAFGPLPNNFWAWGLFDTDGKRQDSAPDFIGPDRTSSSNNGRIEINLSCIRCHYDPKMGGEAGLQNIDSWARTLFTGPLVLQSPDYAILKELRQKYLRDIEGPLADDRRTHGRAIKEATGMTPAAWSAGYAGMFATYEAPVAADRAAREIGMDAKAFRAGLGEYLRRTGSLDPVLASLMVGGRVPIRQYEEVFPVMMLVSKGIQP